MPKLMLASSFLSASMLSVLPPEAVPKCEADMEGSCTMVVKQNGINGVQFECWGHCFLIGDCKLTGGAVQSCQCNGVTVTGCTGCLTTVAGIATHDCLKTEPCPAAAPKCSDPDFIDPAWPGFWVSVCCCH